MIKYLKITVLSENTSQHADLMPEHGFSLFIETENQHIVFDTGASKNFLENAQKLGLNIMNNDGVILSHSHYDHTAGLGFLHNNTVYVHKSFFQPKYKKVDDNYFFIGLKHTKEYYWEHNGLEFVEFEDSLQLTSNILLMGNFPKVPVESCFFIKNNNSYEKDYFKDEIVMVINTFKGLVIITGCAHSGIINILDSVIRKTRNEQIYGLFGGFHLSKLSEEENKQIAEKLNSYKIANIGISHCTGNDLAKYLKGNVFNFTTGESWKLKV